MLRRTKRERSGNTHTRFSSIFTEFGQKKYQEKFSINIARPKVKTSPNNSLWKGFLKDLYIRKWLPKKTPKNEMVRTIFKGVIPYVKK